MRPDGLQSILSHWVDIRTRTQMELNASLTTHNPSAFAKCTKPPSARTHSELCPEMITCILIFQLFLSSGKSRQILTLRGSPSPDPESWSRREPPPGRGSKKFMASSEQLSVAGCLSASGSSAAWRPNNDAKGIYIRGRGLRTGTGRISGSRVRVGVEGARDQNRLIACFLIHFNFPML